MSDEAMRQHARLAQGKGLASAPPSKPNPGYKKGGKVMSKPMKKVSGRGR